jgi:polysaccharide pyruvyl transferase WcaK-like protein
MESIDKAGKPVVQVIGWYGKRNLGDDLFYKAMGLLFAEFDLKFSDGDIDTEAVAVLLGPGDVMDPWYLRNFTGNIPLIAFGVGFRVKGEAELLQQQAFARVVFRSSMDKDTAETIGQTASVMADPVFCLYPDVIRREGARDTNKALLICNEEVNSRWKVDSPSRLAAFSYATYFSEVIAKGFSLLEQDYWTVWPVFSEYSPNDMCMILDIGSRFTQPLTNQDIVHFKDEKDIRDIFSSSKFCVSMRLHGIILALLHEVPVLAISVGRKFDALMHDLGLTEWLIPADSLSWVRLEEKLEKIAAVSWADYSKNLNLELLRDAVFAEADICKNIILDSIAAHELLAPTS